MKRPSDVAAYSALTVAAFVWGGSIVGQKIALDAFSAVETSVFRGIGALAILVPLWWWQESPRAKFAPHDLMVLAALGMGVLGNHLLTLIGLRYIGAAAAGVIIGASPAITAFLSALLIRDVPFTTVAGGCLLSFGGVALVSGYGGEGAGGSNPWIGGILVSLGLVSWSLYTIGGRRIMERFSPLTVNWTTLFVSLVVQIPLLATDHKFLVGGVSTVPVGGWMAMVYLVVFATALGQQAWLYGVRGVGPSRAGVFVNLIPVSALALSALVLGEPIGAREIVGIALILAGVGLVGWQSARLKSASSG
jgi:drug/metabolite transporter (DMT)-like permease